MMEPGQEGSLAAAMAASKFTPQDLARFLLDLRARVEALEQGAVTHSLMSSHQRRIAELEAENRKLRGQIQNLQARELATPAGTRNLDHEQPTYRRIPTPPMRQAAPSDAQVTADLPAPKQPPSPEPRIVDEFEQMQAELDEFIDNVPDPANRRRRYSLRRG